MTVSYLRLFEEFVLLLLVLSSSMPSLSLFAAPGLQDSTLFDVPHLLSLREEVRNVFFHSYNSYLTYGYPYDEVLPISCKSRRHDQRERGTLDDVLGGYYLTLIDSLDTLLVMREFNRFGEALQLLANVSFSSDVDVSVFEVNIRIVGGLLGAHQLALTMKESLNGSYDGRSLLRMAEDITRRILPAFATKTGIPIHRVNLMSGVNNSESQVTCPAAGGSFLLEMGLLSRLTGKPEYEQAARRATKALWERRSSIGLLGSTIDVRSGKWLQTHSGIGAGVDSIFETMLKSHILLGDEEMLSSFVEAYGAAQKFTLRDGLNIEVDMHSGLPHYFYVSALQAFWPALQVLSGHLSAASKTFTHLHGLWSKYKALPDIFDMKHNALLPWARDSPLRPELIESAFYLYSATNDEKYLKFGRDVLWALQNKSRVKCGYASIADVETGRLDDRMDSFFLSESLKYLFLLFDEGLPEALRESAFCNAFKESRNSTTEPQDSIQSGLSDGDHQRSIRPCVSKVNSLFSTEGHVFIIDSSLRFGKSTVVTRGDRQAASSAVGTGEGADHTINEKQRASGIKSREQQNYMCHSTILH